MQKIHFKSLILTLRDEATKLGKASWDAFNQECKTLLKLLLPKLTTLFHNGQMYRQTSKNSKLLRSIQILIQTASITSQLKCQIITMKPLLTPLKFTAFLASLVSIYLMPVKFKKNQNQQFLPALLLYMGQTLNQVSKF